MIAERQTARNHRASHKLVRGTLLKSNSTEILFTASCLAASVSSLFEHQRFVGRLAGKYLRAKWNANFHSRRATLHRRLICSKKNKISSIRPCNIYYDDPANWCGTTWQNNDCIFERQLHMEMSLALRTAASILLFVPYFSFHFPFSFVVWMIGFEWVRCNENTYEDYQCYGKKWAHRLNNSFYRHGCNFMGGVH